MTKDSGDKSKSSIFFGRRCRFESRGFEEDTMRKRLKKSHPGFVVRWTALASFLLVSFLNIRCSGGWESGPRFEISFSQSVSREPITGRVYVLIFKNKDKNPRLMRAFGHQPVSSQTGDPFFGMDVDRLKPGESIIVDSNAVGYPVESLKDLAEGDYYVQAVLHVYTECQRADGHVIWVPLDHWDGQHAGWAPGNLISEVGFFHLDPSKDFVIRLELTEIILPIEEPPDTEWIKRVKIRSDLLTEFWGHPIDIGATILVPEGYDEHPDVYYPVVYSQGHFSLQAPFGFSPEPLEESEAEIERLKNRGIESGYDFYQSWISDDFPRLFAVTFQHPTPYFDDSYAVNSANNGPYADALLKELIPFLEQHFRMIPKGYARVLTGGSTGGYESLALQIHHPGYFGGTWTFYPDPIDFRHLFLINIYEDENSFVAPGYEWLNPERYAVRLADGQPIQSVKQLSQLIRALGSRGRSGEYLEAWEASFGPTAEDGYPKPLWDNQTGAIDREVARYWRDQGYDLVHYLKMNWAEIGPDLVGKIHLYVGDMDNYYFNLPVYALEEFLGSTDKPHYAGTFEYGRPLKEHGWHPMNQGEMLRLMADHITQSAPAGENTRMWKY